MYCYSEHMPIHPRYIAKYKWVTYRAFFKSCKFIQNDIQSQTKKMDNCLQYLSHSVGSGYIVIHDNFLLKL